VQIHSVVVTTLLDLIAQFGLSKVREATEQNLKENRFEIIFAKAKEWKSKGCDN